MDIDGLAPGVALDQDFDDEEEFEELFENPTWLEHFYKENGSEQEPEKIDLSGPSASESDDE